MYPGDVPLEPILEVLQDLDYVVRQEAIECLQKRAGNLPIQPIIGCLQDSSTWVRKKAIEALASLGVRAPLAELMAMMDEPAQEVRFAAVRALAQPGLCERVPARIFVEALSECYDEPRQIILQALRNKDPQLAIEHAIAALGDSDDEFALAAFQLLEELHPALVPEIVQEATSLFEGGTPGRFFRSLSVGFLAEMMGDVDQASPELIARLGELLDWPYWEVRMKAAQALGKLRRNIPDAIIRRLFELRHDPHSRAVREAADRALEEILSLETGIEDD
jgi:HEAT repeat protein